MMTKKKEIERRKNVYIYKKLPDFLNALGISRDSRSRPILIFPTMCNPITRTLFVPQDHSLSFAHAHLSQKVCGYLSPSLKILFSNNLFDEAR
jgi:hypothetical protein